MLNNITTPIFIQKINSNDESYLLAELLVKDGDYIKLNGQIALLETSKTIFELLSPCEGYIYINHKFVGGQVFPSDLFAVVLSTTNFTENEINLIFKNLKEENVTEQIGFGSETVFSKKALQLIQKHALDQKNFTGKSIIREKDVLLYISDLNINTKKISEENNKNVQK